MVMSLKSFLLSQLATLVFYGLLFKYYYAPPTTDWHEICDAREGVGVPSLELLNAILWKVRFFPECSTGHNKYIIRRLWTCIGHNYAVEQFPSAASHGRLSNC